MYGDQAVGLRYMGKHPRLAGYHVQGNGSQKCLFPLFIPKSLQREAEHVDGFARMRRGYPFRLEADANGILQLRGNWTNP